ncbi:MAG: sodium-dependent transporter [Bacillota bacterium]
MSSIKTEKRDTFKSKWGFIVACIGGAVGVGNIWMFPQRVSLYGGGTFLIPYFIFIFLISSSGVIGEMAFGRWAKSGSLGAFGKAVEYRGGNRKLGEAIGMLPVLGSLALALGYTVVVGWMLKYTFGAFSGATLAPSSVEEFANAFGEMAVNFGNTAWQIGAIVLVFAILIFGVGKGIERTNKILMPIFFCLFVGLGIYVAFQDGAIDGYKYILTVNPQGWLDPTVWIFAMGQAFFSLSVAGNGTLIYGSYLDGGEDIPKSAKNVAFFDTLAAVLAAFVIIPAIATTGAQLSDSGPGLMFIYLPNLFASMPGGSLIVIVFFVSVLFAGITSLLNLYETPIATMQEKFGMTRLQASLSIAGVGIVISTYIQGIVSGWMDVVSIYICPIGAMMAGVMFFWVVGENKAMEEINRGSEKGVKPIVLKFSKYVYCLMAVVVLALGAVMGGIG